MELKFSAWVKAIKADVAKKELTISFTMKLTPESLQRAQSLSMFATSEAPAVTLNVDTVQGVLPSEGVISVVSGG